MPQPAVESVRPQRTVKTVLLVDDSAYWTETVAAGLRSEGFVVSVLQDGLAAIERLRRSPPDVLITDYFLANLDGGKLCQLAKRLSGDNPITTIILTGGADQGLSRTPSPYADAVIAKNSTDVVFGDLRAVLHRVRRSQPPSLQPGEVIGHERLIPRVITTKLHGLKQHLDALHEGIGDAVVGVDDEMRVYFLNSMALEIFELNEENSLARPVADVLQIPLEHPLLVRIRDALLGGPRQGRPLTFDCRDYSLRVTVSNVMSPDGRATALIIARDISDLKAAEEARLTIEARLHEADKLASLGNLMASVSHEVNNPLAALMPNLKVLGNHFATLAERLCASGEALPEELETALTEAPALLTESGEAIERIRTVASQMLAFADPTAGAGTLTRIEDLLEGALALLANEVRGRATIRKDFAETPKLIVDRTRLSQAFLNVLLNAVQALEDGNPTRDFIQVTTRVEDGGVRIEVSNSGPAIPPAVLARVFQPFFTTRPAGKGAGLGLSITSDTVRRHGGFIAATSSENTPTMFRIWLPVDTGLALTQPRDVDSTPPRAARILIVDDDKLVRNSLRRILERHHDVTVASNGQRALELFGEQSFDVVLCDLIMPEMSGMDLFQNVKRQNPEQARRFVFLTGGTSIEVARNFLARVPNPRAYKPLSGDDIATLVARCLDNFTLLSN